MLSTGAGDVTFSWRPQQSASLVQIRLEPLSADGSWADPTAVPVIHSVHIGADDRGGANVGRAVYRPTRAIPLPVATDVTVRISTAGCSPAKYNLCIEVIYPS